MIYEIAEILEYSLDNSGLLSIIFRINGDTEEECRYLETDLLVEWAEENDIDRIYWSTEHNEEEDYYDNEFRFDHWWEDNDYPEIVTEFIYDRFSPNDIPLPEKCS